MATFRNDYAYGTQNEEPVRLRLEQFFNRRLHRRDRYAPFDFDDGATLFLELKSRRSHSGAFPTAIIGGNKVDIAKNNPTRTYWFCFQYEDGLYGIQYDPKVFDTFERRLFQRGYRNDFHNNPQECVFIPIRNLISFS